MPKSSVFVVQVLILISLLWNCSRVTKDEHAGSNNTPAESSFKIVSTDPENESDNVSLHQTEVSVERRN